MFFSDSLRVSPLVGPFRLIRGATTKKAEESYSKEEAPRRFESALRRAQIVGHEPMAEVTSKKRRAPKPKKATKR
jgi:hypothetical protein